MRKIFFDDSDSPELTETAASVEVTLSSINEQDEFAERKILLAPNSNVPVGRSSKNATKRLLAAPSNAFIDSPVISREHATLTTNTALGIPKVYITDRGSMHGTKVNGNFVRPNREHQLNNGDTVQFGVDVVRDQGMDSELFLYPAINIPFWDHKADTPLSSSETFIAKRYRFSSRLAPPHPELAFPQGINVPDSISDEEDMDEEHGFFPSSPHAPSYGSQSNPVNVDDFEDMPQEVIDLDDEDSEGEHNPSQPAAIKPAMDVLYMEKEIRSSPVVNYSEDTGLAADASISGPQLSLADDDHNSDEEEPLDENEDGRSVASSEMAMCSYGEDSISGDESMDNSDAELDFSSESGESVVSEESDHEEDRDIVRRLKLGAMINHEHQKTAHTEDAVSLAQAPIIANVQSSPTLQAPLTGPESNKIFGSTPVPFIVRPPVKESEPERFKPTDVEPVNFFNEDYGSSHWLPPRPSAPKPMSWGLPSMSQYGGGSNFLRENAAHNPWVEEAPVGLFTMPMPINDYRADNLPPFTRVPPVLNGAPDHGKQFTPSAPTTISSSSKLEAGFEIHRSVDPASSNNIPTPPMPTSDDLNPPTPQQSSRTKVSIAEIVEEAPAHPPTPNSIASPPGLKRKASVLEEDEDEGAKSSSAVVSEPEAIANETSTIAARPKKRLRSALRFAGTMAAGVAVGAVAVVGGLLYLPQDAFAA